MTTKSASTTGQHLPTKHTRSQPSALRRSHSLAREEGTGRGYRARGWEGLEELKSSCNALCGARRSWHASCGLIAHMGSAGADGAWRGEHHSPDVVVERDSL